MYKLEDIAHAQKLSLVKLLKLGFSMFYYQGNKRPKYKDTSLP